MTEKLFTGRLNHNQNKTKSHDMLSDYVSFHSMYIEETLHKSDSLYFFIGGNSGIGTWNYTKAILIYIDFILGRT